MALSAPAVRTTGTIPMPVIRARVSAAFMKLNVTCRLLRRRSRASITFDPLL
jgi:hypothetical protein